jgi:hypothetical protein
MSLEELFLAYWKHFSGADYFICLFGIVVAGLQLWAYWQARQSNVKSGPAYVALDRKIEWALRVSGFGIDSLPMLGLLGTVGSLLNTLAGMKGTRLADDAIANFAPALTTTISGLLLSLINLAILELALKPEFQRMRKRGRTDG